MGAGGRQRAHVRRHRRHPLAQPPPAPVARNLTISPKTARHHIEHVYNKLGVSTRAAATMFAMEHDLVPH
jgi:hypothetical protein